MTSLSALFAVPLFLAVAGGAEAACEMTKIATLHVSVEDNHIFVPGSINGNPVQFLIATDIESMILSVPAHDMGLRRQSARHEEVMYAEEISGISPAGPVKADLVIDGLPLNDAVMHVIGRRMDFGKPTQTAVLGRDFLHKFDVEFNLPAGEVTLYRSQGCETSNLAYWTSRYNVLEMDHVRGVRVAAEVNGHPVVADINSGNPYTALNIDAAQTLNIVKNAVALPPSHDFLANFPIETSQVMVDSIGLDKEIIHPAALRIRKLTVAPPGIFRLGGQREPETGYARPDLEEVPGDRFQRRGADLSLGVDFIRAHRLLIAYSQLKVYFSYVPGAPFLGSFSATPPGQGTPSQPG